MPIYEYRCQSCGHELEALRKIYEEPLLDCPACGNAALKKKVTAASFRLKGSGWYETDFKHGNRPPETSDKSGDSAKSGESGESGDSAKSGKAEKATGSAESGGSGGSGDSSGGGKAAQGADGATTSSTVGTAKAGTGRGAEHP